MNWFKNFFKENKSMAIKKPRIFFGHDLNMWDYLGKTDVKYVDENGKPTLTTDLYFFCDKNDESIRSIHIEYENLFKSHTFYKDFAKLWALNEKNLYSGIGQPSETLIKKAKSHNYVPVYKAGKCAGWKKCIDTTEDDNVITVENWKKKDES